MRGVSGGNPALLFKSGNSSAEIAGMMMMSLCFTTYQPMRVICIKMVYQLGFEKRYNDNVSVMDEYIMLKENSRC